MVLFVAEFKRLIMGDLNKKFTLKMISEKFGLSIIKILSPSYKHIFWKILIMLQSDLKLVITFK